MAICGVLYFSVSVVVDKVDFKFIPGGDFWHSLALIAIAYVATVLLGKQCGLFGSSPSGESRKSSTIT